MEINLTYFLGYILGKDIVNSFIHRYQKFKQIQKYEAENDFDLTFILRLAPVAIEPVSLYLGASNNNYQNYIFASLIGIFPKLLFFTFIGEVFMNSFISFNIILGVILFLGWFLLIIRFRLLAVLKRLFKNYKQKTS